MHIWGRHYGHPKLIHSLAGCISTLQMHVINMVFFDSFFFFLMWIVARISSLYLWAVSFLKGNPKGALFLYKMSPYGHHLYHVQENKSKCAAHQLRQHSHQHRLSWGTDCDLKTSAWENKPKNQVKKSTTFTHWSHCWPLA